MHTASRVAAAFTRFRASMVFVDGGGVGGGVVDRLRQLQIPVMEVDFGSSPDGGDMNDGTKYANKRAEIWGRMREWLKVGSIPKVVRGVEVTLVDELTAPSYSLNTGEAILLESKKSMRFRGVISPNIADALACTFAFDFYIPEEFPREIPAAFIIADYNPYSPERMNT